jgi:hypothetical protein
MTSACRGEALKTSEPNRAMSNVAKLVLIISIPQHDVAKVNGQIELDRPQFSKKSTEEIMIFINNFYLLKY